MKFSTLQSITLKRTGIILTVVIAAFVLQPYLSGIGVQLESHRLGVCDVQIVLDRIPQGKQITDDFSVLRSSMENELRQKETQLKQSQQEASQLRAGTDGRREIEKTIALIQAELKWLQEDLEQEFAARFKARRDELVKLVREAIEEIAEEQEIDLVVNNVARASDFKVYVSVWARKELDITEQVITRVASKMGDR